MKPYFEDDSVVIYHGDCREVLPTLGKVDAVVTDPPYGMNWNTDATRFSGGHIDSMNKRGMGRDWGKPVAGDDKPFDPSAWLAFDHVILWGQNHFAERLPVGTMLVWIKRNDEAYGSFLSDAEVAWRKGGHGVYCKRDLSMNAEAKRRVHPTQKPVGIMEWCLGFIPEAALILDPFMGSGTTLVAAKRLGRKAIGIELDERYCEIAARRCGSMERVDADDEPLLSMMMD